MATATHDVLLRWTAHPAKARPRDVALVASVVLLTMGGVLTMFESPWLTVLAGIILVGSVAAFLFPTHYLMTSAGIELRRLGRSRYRHWSDLRRLTVGPDAALVSPFRRPSWLDRHRGIVVMFDGVDRARVVDLLEEKLRGER